MTFKCCYCHVFVMCSFNTWLKLSTGPDPVGKLYFLQNLESLFIPFLNLLQREECLIHVLHDQPSELVRTLMMRFPKQSVVGRRLYNSCCLWMLTTRTIDWNMTEKWRLVNQLQKPWRSWDKNRRKSHNGYVQFLLHCHIASPLTLMLKGGQVIRWTAKKHIIRQDYVGQLTDEWKIYQGQEIPEDWYITGHQGDGSKSYWKVYHYWKRVFGAQNSTESPHYYVLPKFVKAYSA